MFNDFKSCLAVGLVMLGVTVVIVGVVAGLISLSAWLTMMAWNLFAAGVFHLPAITFFQAWGLHFLAGLVKGVLIINRSK